MLHFSNNLEYYIKTRAIQSVCNELDAQMTEIQGERGEIERGRTDMDYLIQIHDEYMSKIMKLCLLD